MFCAGREAPSRASAAYRREWERRRSSRPVGSRTSAVREGTRRAARYRPRALTWCWPGGEARCRTRSTEPCIRSASPSTRAARQWVAVFCPGREAVTVWCGLPSAITGHTCSTAMVAGFCAGREALTAVLRRIHHRSHARRSKLDMFCTGRHALTASASAHHRCVAHQRFTALRGTRSSDSVRLQRIGAHRDCFEPMAGHVGTRTGSAATGEAGRRNTQLQKRDPRHRKAGSRGSGRAVDDRRRQARGRWRRSASDRRNSPFEQGR